jgi:hypothetical protein
LLKKKLTIKAIVGLIQSILSFAAMILAFIFKFDLFNAQTLLNVPIDSLNFYFLFLLVFGSVSVLGGLFLIYDWWES